MVYRVVTAWLLAFMVLAGLPCWSADDNIASLEQQLISAQDNNKAPILFALLDKHRNSDPKLAIDYGEQALALLSEFPNDKIKMSVLNEMSWALRLIGLYEKALSAAKEGQQLALALDDQQGLGRALNNMGVIYWSLGDYNQVLDYWLRSLAVRQAANDENGVAGSLNNIGQVYFHLNDNERAIHFLEQALAISTKIGNREYLVNHLDNLGEIYLKLALYSQAEVAFLQAKTIASEDENNKALISILINLGQLHLFTDQFSQAEDLLQQANKIAQQRGFTEKAIESTQKLALIAYKKSSYDQALSLAQQALVDATKLTNTQLLIDIYSLISKVKEAQQDFQGSLIAFKDYQKFSELLLSQSKQNQITALQLQFETLQQERQIKLLTAENALRDIKIQNIEKYEFMLHAGIAILTCGILLLIWGYRVKSKANLLINQQYQQLEQTRQELHQLAVTDPLTKLFNRRAIHDRLDLELARVNTTKSSLCLCIMDLDNFKLINDNYGHEFGDFILTEVAHILLHEIRIEDAVGRWGGEEFFILLTDTEMEGAETILQRLRNKISAKRFTLNNTTKHITATIGFSIYQASVTAFKDVMKAADDALYEGKKSGRNQVVVKDIR